jgi:hypothetical protein
VDGDPIVIGDCLANPGRFLPTPYACDALSEGKGSEMINDPPLMVQMGNTTAPPRLLQAKPVWERIRAENTRIPLSGFAASLPTAAID